MQLKLTAPLDLEATLTCGQAFRWKRVRDWWCGPVGTGVWKLRTRAYKTRHYLEAQYLSLAQRANRGDLSLYLRFEDDLVAIQREISVDPVIRRAIEHFPGIRLLRQPPYECLIAFLCSQNMGIGGIERMLETVSIKFSRPVDVDGQTFYPLPPPEVLAGVPPSELARCGLGYRAPYMAACTSCLAAQPGILEKARRASYDEAREILLGRTDGNKSFPGIGSKVAECILLYSLDKLDAFPVDVWVRRVLAEYYADRLGRTVGEKLRSGGSLSTGDLEIIRRSALDHFGPRAGYAQLYLYHAKRVGVI